MPELNTRWGRLFAEGVAIVLSILLAFGIEAWWQAREDRAEEYQILLAISEELRANQETLRGNLTTVEVAQARVRDFLAKTPSEASEIHPDSVWSFVFVPLTRSFTSELTLGSLNSTISSGKLNLIQNPRLRAALVEINAIDEDVGELRRAQSQLALDATRVLGRHPSIGALVSTATGANLNAVPPERIAPEVVADMRADPDISGAAASKARFWTGYSLETGRLLRHLQAVESLIDQELETHSP